MKPEDLKDDRSPTNKVPRICSWCKTDAEEARRRYERSHATWCPYHDRLEVIR